MRGTEQANGVKCWEPRGCGCANERASAREEPASRIELWLLATLAHRI